MFADPRFSGDDFNAFSCATCHDDGSSDAEARLYAGHSLVDSVHRDSWWGGHTVALKDAVDSCLFFFMREQPLQADEPRARALYEYLLSISPAGSTTSSLPALPLTIVENVTSVPRGDPTAPFSASAERCRRFRSRPCPTTTSARCWPILLPHHDFPSCRSGLVSGGPQRRRL